MEGEEPIGVVGTDRAQVHGAAVGQHDIGVPLREVGRGHGAKLPAGPGRRPGLQPPAGAKSVLCGRAVVLLVAQGFVINRLAGIDYPVWAPRSAPS
jgi:hypothetical protein